MSTSKRKILMLCDHPLSTSGVGTQARWLINGLVETGKYSFRVFGGAVKHENYNVIKVNDDFIVKPTDGFGNREMLRHAIATERPDAIVLFTDPRFFIWVWEMEDEIHQVCPIAYNHLWDNPPWPEFNRVLYESTDLVNCINYPTYEMVHERFPEKTNYIPHGVPANLYKKLSSSEIDMWRSKLVGKERKDHFLAMFVGRNARRKMPSDILKSWKMFLVELEKKYGHRDAVLVMHTNPKDTEGPNLMHVIDMFHLQDNVMFSNTLIDFPQMNALYNAVDCVVNRSCNEGFGLPILEAKMTETPCISIKTGGLTRQIEDHETGEEYGIALEPDTKCLVGNQMVPYIYEDFVTHETLADAYMKMFEMGPEARVELGKKCYDHAMKHYDLKDVVRRWDETLGNLCDNWKVENHERWRHVEL